MPATAARMSTDELYITDCWSGVASNSQPCWKNGGLSEGTRPCSRSMMKNGSPNTSPVSSTHKISGTGTLPEAAMFCIDRYCTLMS